jgi:hypothetical protein
MIKKTFLRLVSEINDKSSFLSEDRLEYSGLISPSICSKEELLFVLPQTSACMVDWDVSPKFSILTYSSSGDDFDNSFLRGLASSSGECIHNHISFNTEGWGESFCKIIDYVGPNVKHMIIANDDVFVTSSDINRLFSVAVSHQLDFYHPSLSRCSFCTHGSLLHKQGSVVRKVDHIEGIFPGFSANALASLKKFPCLSLSGYGFDVGLWPAIASSQDMVTALVDAVIVRHMRPVDSGERIYSNGLTARQEALAVREFLRTSQSLFSVSSP